MPLRDVPPAESAAERELRLPRQMYDEIVQHLGLSLPWEGCGLIGAEFDGHVVVARRFYPGENADKSPTRFTMEPVQVIAAFKSMREEGLELGAIVHSHPTSAAVPSPTDRREAYYPDSLSVIVSFREPVADFRAWEWLGNEVPRTFREIRIVVDPHRDPA